MAVPLPLGPDSVAWRIHADASMIVGGMRALMIQACEPRAMAGVDQHSDFRDDPWGRLHRTSEFVLGTTYGDRATAERLARRVRTVHATVTGTDPATGQAYRADDPDLLLWIHAVETHSFLFAYRTYAGAVSREDADRYVREMAAINELVGLPPELAPKGIGELREYLRTVPGLLVTPAAREALWTLLTPPMRLRYRPLWVVPLSAAIAILPRRIRELYGLPWVEPATPFVRAAVYPLARALDVWMPKSPMVREARARAAAAAAGSTSAYSRS
jgi:uncharacterized protein (DUF2236 family)